MKYIFDFDNVLFHTSKHFKEHLFITLGEVGISRNSAQEYYNKEHWNQFSLKKMLAYLSVAEDLYEKIMNRNQFFLNKELLEIIRKMKSSDCYIVTYGDEEFQSDKIKRCGISHLFSEIIIVSGSKKGAIEKLCAKHKYEQVIFIDDKAQHFEDLDFIKFPNLKTILYDENGMEKLKAKI